MANNRLPYRTTLVNFHLPVSLAERLDKAAKELGRPKVKLAIEAFEGYLLQLAPKPVSEQVLDEDV